MEGWFSPHASVSPTKNLRTGSIGPTVTTELFLPLGFGTIIFLSFLRHFVIVNKVKLTTMNYFQCSLVIL